ncbi:preprotein translocase subunit SecA [Buchnera aphidicola]|uniref:Protein translocase subunit SecA n=1 Tax=Buchnera aphidicola subsp. Cinara cedri (strain Cc) TaxID=372461 RepID=SECA_BUCCC|nr:preprotein translocase subunit SecA [Buchnera aphidicola]Q057U3.1 RecName: Full=Protein translocase subunit SecA [Buchnera aphidicola BCc]ABJ90606.1 preprotein translocase subunit (ATPase) [Buchnera aphidicola BCc]
MLGKLINKFFLSRNERILKNLNDLVIKINILEKDLLKLSDKELKKKTNEFKLRLKYGDSLDSLLPEAFSVIREASKRIFGMRHFDVQILGGIILHKQCIAEMRTGEGKTLTATLPAYLNALTGKGVHIVTMNDYLAQRDANKNRILFEFLGLTVGINVSGMSRLDKKNAYLADITYGTNHEYGFDYLRDNMVFNSEKKVQRKLYFALIDEVDSILIDEARTPLVISGPIENSNILYDRINSLVSDLIPQNKKYDNSFNEIGDFCIDYKQRQVNLTEMGLKKIEKLLVKYKFISKEESLYLSKNIFFIHHILLALKAHYLFLKNVDYIIKDDQIIIVDEHTGRIMSSRRWSDGLHQAIEAKENVFIQNDNQTLATMTLQNYFRLYKKLSGMTGTASTEAFEFNSIYNLDTVIIPTNKPMIRNDLPDLVFVSKSDKMNAIISDIKNCVFRQQPVLVGTVSIEKSEKISRLLNKLNIKHNVLNAKFHSQEADIIAKAGEPNAVTIATNMAGRGTDIVLGGILKKENNEKFFTTKNSVKLLNIWKKKNRLVIKSGGLHIIGTERHESRRIDNQLRGRSGRQGDPGSSRFYLSLEDTLMKFFASENVIKIIKTLGLKSNQSIEHPWLNSAIERAQKKVENCNFDIRKQLLEYDNVINEQRSVIYNERNKLINKLDIHDHILFILKDRINFCIKQYISGNSMNVDSFFALEKELKNNFYFIKSINKFLEHDTTLYENVDKLIDLIVTTIQFSYNKNTAIVSKKYSNMIEKSVMLQILDIFWIEHLNAVDFLKQSIHLRGYAQQDPQQEYKRESFFMFQSMLEAIKNNVIKSLINIFFVDFKKNKNIYINFIDQKDYDSFHFLIMKSINIT